MANTTLFVLLVASICLLGDAAPVNPGQARGIINRSGGRSRGLAMEIIRRNSAAQFQQATTEAQKTCIAEGQKQAIVEAQTRIGELTRELVLKNMNGSQTDLLPFKAEVDGQFESLLKTMLPPMLDKVQQC